MSRDFTDDFVAKVRLLEESVGHQATYRLLDPFPLDASNAIQIQAAARRIAEFIGLAHYSFIVSLCRQKENVGGHIELQPSGTEVFIEVADNFSSSPLTVLATLAHELTHKYLQIHRVTSGVGPTQSYEDEILTDIASVWLGLGKLVLNGCESESRRVERTATGSQTTTTHHRVGYLTKDEFAFVYVLVCSMRGISESEYRRALTSEAIDELHYARQRRGDCLDPDFGTIEAPLRVRSRLQQAVDRCQKTCASVSRDAAVLRRACLDATQSFLVDSHSRLKSKRDEFERVVRTDHVNPCLRFLHNVELSRMTSRWESEIDGIAHRADEYVTALNKTLAVARASAGIFPPVSDEMLATIACPQDGTLLRVPLGHGQLRVRCAVCRYDWLVETTTSEPPVRPPSSQRRGAVAWFRSLFRR